MGAAAVTQTSASRREFLAVSAHAGLGTLALSLGGGALRPRENHSMEAHPMHLHGQSFRVLAVGGVRYREPIVKDSVDVDAHMGSVVLEFTAHNPGDWFFHCHKPMHMEGGMITLAKIA